MPDAENFEITSAHEDLTIYRDDFKGNGHGDVHGELDC
jgi:pyrimidine operon attenuation protein/uracil phosphoribosyltransferase